MPSVWGWSHHGTMLGLREPLLIEGGTARWHQLLPLMLLQQLLQRRCVLCVWEDAKELGVTGLWPRSPLPPPSQGAPDLSFR